MANGEQQLAILLEARMRDFEKSFQKARALTDSNWTDIESRTRRGAKSVEDSFTGLSRRANDALSSIGKSFTDPMRAAAGLFTTAISTQQVIRYADQWKSAGNALAGAGVELDKVAATQQVIADIADRSRAEIGSTAELYARMTRSSKDLGASQAQIAVATEIVAKGLKLSGASAGETAGAMLQLSQALQSGKLNGDELRSLGESAPIIMQAIAKEFGVAVGELKKLGADGKLTADRVFKAIVASADEVEAAFAKTTPTVADSFQRLENAAMRFVGTSATVKLATDGISTGLQSLSNNVGALATGATALGAVIAARLIGAGLTPLLAGLGRTVVAGAATAGSMNALDLALVATVARTNAASIAAAGLSRVLALVGGPVGLVVLGLGAAMLYAGQQSAEAEARAKHYADALEEVQAKAKASAGAIDEHTDAIVRAAQAQANEQTNVLGKGIAESENDVRRFTSQIVQLLTGYAAMSRKLSDPKDVQALHELARGLDGTTDSAGRTKERLYELANANPNFQEIADKLKPLLNQLIGAGAYADQLRAKLAAVPQAVADAKAKALESAITSGVPSVSYGDATAAGMNDPVLRALKGQGMLQREVAHAELEKTARAVADEKKKLVEDILGAGGIVDPAAAELAAKRIIAAKEAQKAARGGGSDTEDEYERMNRRILEHIDMLNAEAVAVGKSEREKAKARITQQLLTAAQQAGTTITDKERAAIDTLAERYANAAVHLEKLQKKERESIEAADAFRDATKDVLSGFISDLRHGKSAVEALNNVMIKITDKLIDALINKLVTGMLGASGTPGLGLFGGLLKIFGFAEGGYVRGPGTSTSDSIPARLSDGEFVVNAASTKRNLPLLQAINDNRVLKFAAGGLVGATPIRVPVATSTPAMNQTIHVSPTINLTAAGGSPEQNADLAAKVSKSVTENMRALVIGELMNQARHGGVIAKMIGR